MAVTEFTLDTSGEIDFGPHPEIGLPAPLTFTRYVWWDDFSPFAQGYVEAALRELNEREQTSSAGLGCWGFRHLHPEALAMILRDCEAAQAGDSQSLVRRNPQERGRRFWKARQEGVLPSFPPLRVYLDDAGKVRLEAAQ